MDEEKEESSSPRGGECAEVMGAIVYCLLFQGDRGWILDRIDRCIHKLAERGSQHIIAIMVWWAIVTAQTDKAV
jgi:hypothetical protein